MFRLTVKLHGKEVTALELESGREYVFGRASECDVQLEERPGISRHHFRVAEIDGQWQAQVIAKFGDLVLAGQPAQTILLEPGISFRLDAYDFRFEELTAHLPAVQNHHQENPSAEQDLGANAPHSQLPVEAAPQQAALQSANPQSADPQKTNQLQQFEGNEEATRVLEAAPTIPHLRVVSANGAQELLKLEGRKWLAGRTDGCEIILDDRKASRRHFELTSSPQGYFIRDLGSANGTLVNGAKLASDELRAIRSGDVIQVGSLALTFELRDPHFEKKLQHIPQEVLFAPPAIVHSEPYEIINYPVLTGPGGAVRVDAPNSLAQYDAQEGRFEIHDPAHARTKKIRLILITVVIAMAAAWYQKNRAPSQEEKKSVQVANDPFSKLSPQDQRTVRETFVLAKRLYMQGKHSLAASELKRIHTLLPEGYENSLAIAEELRAQAEQEANLRALQEQQKQLEENARRVQDNLRRCERMSLTSTDVDALKTCLSDAIILDPTNAKISEMISRVEQRIADRQAREAQAKELAKRVAEGRALFSAARDLENKEDLLSAIEAYKKHIDSPFPDPEGLKRRSSRNMAAIQARINSQVDEALRAAETAFSAQNYRQAINEINRAKKFDPFNQRTAELNRKVRKEVELKMKEIYQDSIISEGIGQIEEAKTKWREILEKDHPEGEYYKRARNKLKAYGGA